MPADIGHRAGLSALRPETVAESAKLPTDNDTSFPFYGVDPLMAERLNPNNPG